MNFKGISKGGLRLFATLCIAVISTNSALADCTDLIIPKKWSASLDGNYEYNIQRWKGVFKGGCEPDGERTATIPIKTKPPNACTREFVAKRRADGCSSPTKNGEYTTKFAPACNEHDVCYATPGKTKKQCDDAFLDNMQAMCKHDSAGCSLMASTFFSAVALNGGTSYEGGQSWGRSNCGETFHLTPKVSQNACVSFSPSIIKKSPDSIGLKEKCGSDPRLTENFGYRSQMKLLATDGVTYKKDQGCLRVDKKAKDGDYVLIKECPSHLPSKETRYRHDIIFAAWDKIRVDNGDYVQWKKEALPRQKPDYVKATKEHPYEKYRSDSPAENLCLSKKSRESDALVVKTCDQNDPLQLWYYPD